MNRFFRGAVNPGIAAYSANNVGYMRPSVTAYPSAYAGNPPVTAYPSAYTGYQPSGSQNVWTPQVVPQQPQQQAQQQQTVIPNQTNIIWIESVDEISNYPTGKGWQQWFGDKNNPVLYVRDTDQNGVIQPIAKLRYEVIEDQAPSTGEQSSAQPTSAPAYDGPTRDEFDELSKSVSSILTKLDELMK